MKKQFFKRCMAILLIFSMILSFLSGIGETIVMASSLSRETSFTQNPDIVREYSTMPVSKDSSALDDNSLGVEQTGDGTFQKKLDDTIESKIDLQTHTTAEANDTAGENDSVNLAPENSSNELETEVIPETITTEDFTSADTSGDAFQEDLTEKNAVSEDVNSENTTFSDTTMEGAPDTVTSQESTDSLSKDLSNQESDRSIQDTFSLSATQDDASMFDELLQDEQLTTALADDKDSIGYIIAARAWSSGHYVWYVNSGNGGHHYIFCMEKGKVMRSNIFKPSKFSGTFGTPQNTFRIATALHYFQSNGGWGSENGYVDTQYTIWNEGQTKEAAALITYANYLWKLTEQNPDRKAGSGSFSSHLTAVKESEVNTKEKRIHTDVTSYKIKKYDTDSSYAIKHTISLSGSAWKYFAKGGSGEWNSSSPGSHGNLTVYGCFAPDGSKLSSETATASIANDGSLHIKMNQQDDNSNPIATSKENAILVVVKAEHDFSGANSIQYLDCGSTTQKLAYNAEFASPAYFAIKLYADSTIEEKPASLIINKTDEFGNAVEGAEFVIRGQDITDKPIAGLPVTLTAADNTYLFTVEGAYQIEETKAPYGMDRLGLISNLQTYTRPDGNVNTLYIEPRYTAAPVTAVTTDQGISYTYTVTNTYQSGSAYLKKAGNVFVAYENGEFIYQDRNLDNVTFDLYAGEDIYAGNQLIFSNDQQITSELLEQSVWNTIGKHEAVIEKVTDSEGTIYFRNLPPGSYYVVESDNPYDGYGISGTRLEFEIVPNETTQIHDGTYYNNPVYANCLAVKVDTDDASKKLEGAEFTLYAHIDNTNFDGDKLFRVEDTKPAVVSRTNGIEHTESNTWIPLDTVVSDKNGQAMFSAPLPYGKYMVVETLAPEGYSLCEESYEFTHTFDREETYASGVLFTHTFGNTEQSNLIVIRKTGDVLASSTTVNTPYGNYEKLQYQPFAVQDVVFEIYDASGTLVETVTTDQTGIATSHTLKPGKYTIKEIDNGGSLRLDTTVREVELKKDATATVQSQTVEFMNESLSTTFHIYKQGEIASFTSPVEGVSHTDQLYSYHTENIADVVFGVFTKEDIRNAEGTVIVKAESCMGYCVTDTTGIATLSEKLCNGSYYYMEVQTADDTFIEDPSHYDFMVKLNGTDLEQDLNKEVPLINQKCRGSIKVIKTNGIHTIALSDVQFALYDSKNTLLGTFLTDQNGMLEIEELPMDTYYLQETDTLEDYILDDTVHEINLTRSNPNQALELENQLKDQEAATEDEVDNVEKKQISSHKKTQTGDKTKNIIWLFFLSSITGLIILCQIRKGGKHNVNTSES